MKPNIINRTLMPPEDKPDDTDAKIADLLEYVRKNYKITDLFDTYDHDKGVAKNFYNWFEASGWMDASIINDGYKIGEWYINTDPKTPDKITFEQLFEIYCTK